MRLEIAEARDRFARSPVLRLATVGSDGRPHLVPCTFIVDDRGLVVIGIDNKPKSSANLRRLANLADDPRVSMLVDHYADDWTQLWWVRADGIAAVQTSGPEHRERWRQLSTKYPQYRGQILAGPVIVATVESWTGWAYTKR